MQPMPLPHSVTEIMTRLTDAGYHVYVVGGSVRDALRGITPHDYDMTTDATPAEMKAVFTDLRVIETGMKHGTLTILADGTPHEVTTYREDGDYRDHRHPDEVTFTRSLTEDLARRDFTMNAIAYHPAEGYIDPFNGEADIRTGVIRAVGDPTRRFTEDALRILRGLRFSAVLGYTIEPATADAMYTTRALLSHVSAERVREELCRLLAGDHAAAVIRSHHEILAVRLPQLADPAEETLAVLATLPPDPVLRLTALLFPVVGDPEKMDSIMRELKFDNISRLRAVNLITYRDIPISSERREVLHLLSRIGAAALDDLCLLRGEDPARDVAHHLITEGIPYRITDLAVTGEDILRATTLRGPAVGEVLNRLLNAVISDEVENNRDALLAYLN